jgi:Fe-S-cluster containining protein
MVKRSEPSEWYADGLRFTCTQCGNCCSGPSGYVWFDQDELVAMAGYLKLSVAQFIEQYAHEVNGYYSLEEVCINGEYDCVFLKRDADGKGLCSIYPVRPAQCRTWPFWPDNLKHPRDWQKAGRRCPGIARGNEGHGELFPIEEIRIRRDATPE